MSTKSKSEAKHMAEKTIRTALKHLGCASAFAVVLAGCAQKPIAGLGQEPSSYQQRHPIIVGNAPTTLDIPTANQRTHLTSGAKSAIANFAYTYRQSKAKGMEILVPSGSSNEAEANHIARHARTLLKHRGVPSKHISMRSYTADSAEHPGHVRLVYHSIKAQVASECGVWPTDIGKDFQNRNYENFGCATQSNLAAIVADPNDLISPRGPGSINAERTAIVVGDFESNEVAEVTAAQVSDF